MANYKYEDITGEVFGRLTAVEYIGKSRWRCQCSCGETHTTTKNNLRTGFVSSCGCLHLELCKAGTNQTRHGDAKVGQVSRLHSIWRGMLKRCNPNNNKFAIEHHAARGIQVCDEWQVYEAFKEWALSHGYTDNLTIERDNVDGHYSPNNCSWATQKQQCRNRTTTRWIELDGKRLALAAWLENTGVSGSAFYNRIKRGWPLRKALGLPVKEPLCSLP